MDKQKKKAFLNDLVDLMERYKLAIIPTFELQASLHDAMVIVDLTDSIKEYVTDRTFLEDFP